MGLLTLSTLRALEDALREVAGSNLILDVGGAPYVDSAGLGTILRHWSDTQRAGCGFGVTGVTPRIAMLLEITRVNTILPVFPSAQAAELSFSSGQRTSEPRP